MRNLRQEKREKASPRRHMGFYISLAFCMIAALGAAWATVGDLTDSSVPPAVEISPQEAPAAQEISGEEYDVSRISGAVKSSESKPAQESTVESKTAAVSDEPAEAPVPRVALPIEKGEIQRPFSPNNPLYSKTMKDWRTHGGIDIRAEEGTAVKAMMDGKVKKLYSDPLLGNVIVIEQVGGYEVSYCGVTDTSIAQEGNTVQAGETIGYVGKVPGESLEGAHLHLEVRCQGGRVDPSELLMTAGKKG